MFLPCIQQKNICLSGTEVARPHLTGAGVVISAHGSLAGFDWMIPHLGFRSQGHSPGWHSMSHEDKGRSKEENSQIWPFPNLNFLFSFFHSAFIITLRSCQASLLLGDADRVKALRERETGSCAPGSSLQCKRVRSQSQVI